MKKAIVTLTLAAGFFTMQANAQTVTSGIKAEANMSNFTLKDAGGAESKMGFGATIGGFGKIGFGENFAVQPELLLHYKTSKMEQGPVETDFQYFGVEIPIYAVGSMSIGNGKGYIGIGPYVGFGIDARYKNDNSPDTKLYKDDLMQPWDFGAGAMLGYEFNNGIGINAGYKLGFINALENPAGDARMLNQTLSLGVAYRF